MSDDIYDACAWGSHLPALLACLADTVGPVLELGIGHFSTPALHAYCVQADRTLVSLESDPKWYEQFRKFQGGKHFIIQADYDWWMSSSCEQSWSVALIDNSPGGKRRADDFQAWSMTTTKRTRKPLPRCSRDSTTTSPPPTNHQPL